MTSLWFPALLAVGLWLPGWLMGRALRLPGSAGGAVLASSAVLFHAVLLLDALDLTVSFATVGVTLGLACSALGFAAIRRSAPIRPAAAPPAPPAGGERPTRWFWLPAGIGLLAVSLRAALDPLSGFDTPFRWDFLARQILRTGGLSFYPPCEPADFLHYAWCDGIAPLVSTLYLWSYLSFGDVVAGATAPVVILQGVLLGHTVATLAGSRGKAVAAGLAASSSLLLWGVAMGQETGLTALALCLMYACLERCRENPPAGWAVWAGIVAGVGALAREYGLVFPLLGVITLRWQRAPVGDHARFLAPAVLVAAPWYLRSWLKTGNPLWPFPLAGLFPGNGVQADYYHAVGETHGLSLGAASIASVALPLGSLAAAPLAAGFLGAVLGWRRFAPWILGVLVICGLWLWSIGQTSGGPVYSLRVLTPALALGAALGGRMLAERLPVRAQRVAAGLLTLVAIDAAARSLHLPIAPDVRWWDERTGAWREFSRSATRWREHPRWKQIGQAAGPRLILVSDPLCHRALVSAGAHALPFYSPDVHFLFRPESNFAADVAKLRALGFRFIVMTRHNPVLSRQLAPYAFFQTLGRQTPVVIEPLYVVYDLNQPLASTPGA